MNARWNALGLAVLLYLDAVAIAVGVAAALRFNLRHQLGSAGDGGPVGAAVFILFFVFLVMMAGLAVAAAVSALRTPKSGPPAWRATVLSVFVGFNFLTPIAIGSRDPTLVAAVVVPSLLLLLLSRVRLPRHALGLAALPLGLCALAGLVVAIVAAVIDAHDRREQEEFWSIKAAIADGGADGTRRLMDRFHWQGGSGDGELECEALERQRLDALDMLLARGPSSNRSVALMRAIRAGDNAALRAQLADFARLPQDQRDEPCMPQVLALAVCDGRLEVTADWTRALGTPAAVLAQLLDGLAHKQPCTARLDAFVRAQGWLLPSGKLDPKLYEGLAGPLEGALYRDENSFSEKPDTPFAAAVARWMAWPALMRQAIKIGKETLMAWIVRHAPNLDEADSCGTTALASAVADGNSVAVIWLLEHGADPNRAARPSCGAPRMAPLIIALQKKSEYRTLDIVPALLKHRADVDAKGPTGEDARALAKKLDDESALRAIDEAVDGPPPPSEDD